MLRLLTITTLLLALAFPALAKPGYKASAAPDQQRSNPAQEEIFSAAERHMIRAYLQQHPVRQPAPAGPALPPGLQKKVARGKPLPPGWQKKLAAGQTLDYRVYRQGQTLPEDLLKRLPAPPGSEILQVEETILRIDTATRAIIDLFDLVNGK